MTKASKARAAFVASDDVIIETTSRVILDEHAPVSSTALVLAAPIVIEQPELVQIDDAFLAKYRTSIRAKFASGAKFVDLILSLNLTPHDADAIEKLRVVFYDVWLDCIFERTMNLTQAKARAYREELMETKPALWDENAKRAYGATKTAWVDVRERAGLKEVKVADATSKGQGKTKETAIEKEVAAKVDSFEALVREALDVAKYLDLLCNKGAKIKSAGLLTVLSDAARALRVGVHASTLEMAADKASK